eukprot:1754289-Amphidinium_carterae.2
MRACGHKLIKVPLPRVSAQDVSPVFCSPSTSHHTSGCEEQRFAKLDTTALRSRLTQDKATTQRNGDMLGASANSAMIDSKGSKQTHI